MARVTALTQREPRTEFPVPRAGHPLPMTPGKPYASPAACGAPASTLLQHSYHARGSAIARVTVSDKGQIVIPAEIRRLLGIATGAKLNFTVEGQTLRVEVVRRIPASRLQDGYGMLVCKKPGRRRLADFDVAAAMRADGK